MLKKLNEMEYGAEGIIKEINASQDDINSIGLRIGKSLKMVTKQPIKGPVVVITGELEIAIGLNLASEISVDIAE